MCHQKSSGKPKSLKYNGTHQLLVYADDVNIRVLGRNICTVKENTEALLVATKKRSLEENVEQCKFMVMSRYQNEGKIKI
jgi:hypothetical protein